MARETPVIAVDASVVVKWFSEEENTADALRIRDDYVARLVDVASVELLHYEVLNALRYAPDVGIEELKIIASSLEGYQIRLFGLLGDLSVRCIDNALRCGISIYDSAYLALGELENIPVHTADEKLLKKVGGETLRHVSNYNSA
jgi:predicted nucleic acid-binding protein